MSLGAVHRSQFVLLDLELVTKSSNWTNNKEIDKYAMHKILNSSRDEKKLRNSRSFLNIVVHFVYKFSGRVTVR